MVPTHTSALLKSTVHFVKEIVKHIYMLYGYVFLFDGYFIALQIVTLIFNLIQHLDDFGCHSRLN